MNDYNRIAEAIEYITANVNTQPSLDEIASHINLSSYHFQHLFSQWAGVSPKRFLQTLTIKHTKELLNNSESVLNVSNTLGLSSSARLHDHFVAIESITPDEYKSQGAGLNITYGIHATPFGQAIIAIPDQNAGNKKTTRTYHAQPVYPGCRKIRLNRSNRLMDHQ